MFLRAKSGTYNNLIFNVRHKKIAVYQTRRPGRPLDEAIVRCGETSPTLRELLIKGWFTITREREPERERKEC